MKCFHCGAEIRQAMIKAIAFGKGNAHADVQCKACKFWNAVEWSDPKVVAAYSPRDYEEAAKVF
ncbi:MAG: hypothetical protein WC343_11895 [Bacilli bacterium]